MNSSFSLLRDATRMDSQEHSPLLSELVGQAIVLDFRSSYVCLGHLVGFDREFLVLRDADLHDLRDSTATREIYVHDSLRLGIRRNRSRTLIRRDEVVAITRFADVAES
jgi:small nuclear ribonucleoprotein (snRNP)-like protein